MIKILILLTIGIVSLIRWLIANKSHKRSKYLIISAFIQTIPFAYGKAMHTYFSKSQNELEPQRIGEFGNSTRIEISLLFILLIVFFGYFKNKRSLLSDKNDKSLLIIFIFSAISVVNPYNPISLSIAPLLFFILQLIFLLKIIEANFKKSEILQGIFDGLLIISFLQLFLAICFPILGMTTMATIFKGESALDWSDRREGYLSAVGVFVHPGILALHCSLCAVFYLACWLNQYKKRLSFYLTLINIFVIGMTFSRTAYVSSIIALIVIFVVYRNKKNIFSLKSVLSFSFSFAMILLIIYISPLSEMFLQSDVDNQIGNRFAHWYLGTEIWKNSIWIGTGINSHVYYMSNILKITKDMHILDFLISSPIHNIHMIVLAETGLFGFAFWLYFFFSRIKNMSKNSHTMVKETNIFNLTYLGVLTAIFLYGFLGWAPFHFEILGLVIILSFFSSQTQLIRRNSKSHHQLSNQPVD